GLEAGLQTLLVLSGISGRDTADLFPYRPTKVLGSVADLVGRTRDPFVEQTLEEVRPEEIRNRHPRGRGPHRRWRSSARPMRRALLRRAGARRFGPSSPGASRVVPRGRPRGSSAGADPHAVTGGTGRHTEGAVGQALPAAAPCVPAQ